jgi:hypothetical protein
VEEEHTQAPAGRWFDVGGVHEEPGRLRAAWTGIRTAVLVVVSVAMNPDWYEPRRPCAVVIHRRDDGSVVLRFEHDSVEEATLHLSSLRERLGTEDVLDFCRDLGIPASHVVGPGAELDPGADVEWTTVSRSKRAERPGRGG